MATDTHRGNMTAALEALGREVFAELVNDVLAPKPVEPVPAAPSDASSTVAES